MRLNFFFALVTFLLGVVFIFRLGGQRNIVVINLEILIVFYRLRIEIQIVLRGLFISFLTVIGGILVVIYNLLVDKMLVNVVFLVLDRFPVTLAHFDRVVSLLVIVVKRTDLGLVASASVTIYSLVFVGMVESLHSRVTLAAENPVRTHLPARIGGLLVAQILAIFWRVLKDFRWSSEVTHMVCVNAALGVMRILAIWAPSRLIFEHIEREHLHGLEGRVQILAERLCLEQTI